MGETGKRSTVHEPTDIFYCKSKVCRGLDEKEPGSNLPFVLLGDELLELRRGKMFPAYPEGAENEDNDEN